MTGIFWVPVAAVALMVAALLAGPAAAQKPGGVLRIYHQDSPASMSIHEEVTYSTVVPMMGVFNNLVVYRQDVAQNSLDTIVPDLATQWSWRKDGIELTFKLRRDVKWHDGRPFTAADVKCTFDLLLGQSSDKLRLNPRTAWYKSLESYCGWPGGPREINAVAVLRFHGDDWRSVGPLDQNCAEDTFLTP